MHTRNICKLIIKQTPKVSPFCAPTSPYLGTSRSAIHPATRPSAKAALDIPSCQPPTGSDACTIQSLIDSSACSCSCCHNAVFPASAINKFNSKRLCFFSSVASPHPGVDDVPWHLPVTPHDRADLTPSHTRHPMRHVPSWIALEQPTGRSTRPPCPTEAGPLPHPHPLWHPNLPHHRPTGSWTTLHVL